MVDMMRYSQLLSVMRELSSYENEQLSTVQTSEVNMLRELTDGEMEQLFEEF